VDNYSEDRTVELAQKYDVAVYLMGPERNIQRDYGAQQSNGSYLMFIDADMELESSLIKEAVTKCENEGYDALILPLALEGEGFWTECVKLEKESFLNDDMMEAPNRFMKREVYTAVGGYDRTLIVGEDFDLGDRIKERGYKVGRVTSFVRYRDTRTFWQMVKKHYYYGKEMKKYLRKSKGKGVKRFFIIRQAYIKNIHLFARDPVHSAGLVIMKCIQYLAASVGLARSMLMR
jgi:glycosyltransferase involved in cell wall biosynthesis